MTTGQVASWGAAVYEARKADRNQTKVGNCLILLLNYRACLIHQFMPISVYAMW